MYNKFLGRKLRLFSKKLYNKSNWYHKFIGLSIILPLIWMSISGILLNHKELIEDYTMPHWLVPPMYNINNFTRSSIIDFVKIDDKTFIAGKKGIYLLDNKKLISFSNGLRDEVILRKVWDLHYLKNKNILLAATEGGLYYLPIKENLLTNMKQSKESIWKKINITNSPIKKIVETDDELLIFTSSDFFLSTKDLNFKKVTPKRDENNHVTMIELFFHLHDGSAWGMVGKIIFDISGLIIIFLSISAFYIWFLPRRLIKKKGNLKRKRKVYRFFHKYHNKMGLYFIFTILLIAFTAIFMRPPLIVAITDIMVPDIFYPAPRFENPWDKRIENALYDKKRDKLLVQCSDGIWSSNPNLETPFTKEKFKPYFIMGASYFEEVNGDYIIGSFSGLYRYSPDSDKIFDMISKKYVKEVSRVRPSKKHMVTSYFKYNNKEYITTHINGLMDIDGNKVTLFEQPKIMNEIRLPLWNWMFELHNGRMFKMIIGKWYIILVPISSILFFLILISGLFDYLYTSRTKRRIKKAKASTKKQ